ncbi:MAG: hypothetical protein J2P27_02930 [Actinobacteria bacterium]|nr:hypothetical protein [Actinomycetota bacterium]
MPDAQRAEGYLRQRADEELAEASSLGQVQATADDRATTANACVARTAALAGALAAVGAVPESAAVSVLDGVCTALVQRGLLPETELPDEPEPGRARQPGTVRAFPAGATVECGIDGFGFPIRIRLGALVTDEQSARITCRAAYTDPQLAGRPRWWHEGPDPWIAFRGLTAVDDMGGRYDGGLGFWHGSHGKCGEGASFRWAGWSWLDPAPPDETRALEVTFPGRAPARIAMDRAREPAAITAALDPAGAAGRYVDAGSLTLLAASLVPFPGMPLSARPFSTVAIAADLLAAGVLQPDSPSLARLAAVARRRGLGLPGPLAAISPASLPDDWASLADRLGSQNGASGVVFPAAVLPEVDGVRCVITELASRPDITTLRVFAPAWPLIEDGAGPLYGMPQHDVRYHWGVSDDLGRRYAITAYTGGGSIDGVEFPLRLHPPVSAQARELEITLAGRTAQGSVRVRLDWQNDDWESDLPDWQA